MTFSSGPTARLARTAPRPFNPKLVAGTREPTAGAHSPFSLMLNRNDGEQNLTGLTVSPRPGFAATLKGIPYCPESAIASSTPVHGPPSRPPPPVPAASQIGTAVAGAGAGTHPLYVAAGLPGRALQRRPAQPASSSRPSPGPYDLGVVAVRAAITSTRHGPGDRVRPAAADP